MGNNQKLMPLNIQLFAEDGGNQTTEGATGQNAQQNNVQTQNTVQNQTIDYDKIEGMINSRNQKNEDAVLKAYFQKEGLSQDEMKEAIKNFKTQREENKQKQIVDNENLQNQLKDKEAIILKKDIEHEAFLQSLELGVDKKTIPYLTKLADFSNVVNDKGIVEGEKVKEALNKVLDDVPSLKGKEKEGTKGVQIGADTSNSTQPSGNLFDFGFTGVRKH